MSNMPSSDNHATKSSEWWRPAAQLIGERVGKEQNSLECRIVALHWESSPELE